MTIERRHVGKRLSELVINRASGTAYLAGQVADDPKADIAGQTQQVLAQIDALLTEAGSDKSRILAATIYLPSMADFAAINAVWEKWVAAGGAGAHDGRSEAREPRIPDRDPDRRRRADSGVVAMAAIPPRCPRPQRPSSPPRRGARSGWRAGRRRRPSPRDLRRGDGRVLRAGAVRSRAWRGLARLGPGRAHVHRLRRRLAVTALGHSPSAMVKAIEGSRGSSGTSRTG